MAVLSTCTPHLQECNNYIYTGSIFLRPYMRTLVGVLWTLKTSGVVSQIHEPCILAWASHWSKPQHRTYDSVLNAAYFTGANFTTVSPNTTEIDRSSQLENPPFSRGDTPGNITDVCRIVGILNYVQFLSSKISVAALGLFRNLSYDRIKQKKC